MNTIAVFGSVNIDLTAYLHGIPKVGETVSARNLVVGLGGKGTNQCCAAARLGADAHLIGRVGEDEFARRLIVLLEEFDLTAHLERSPNSDTGIALIDVLPDGNNIIRIIGGANDDLSPTDAETSATIIQSADVLLLQHETPLEASLTAARIARTAGTKIIMDPAPAPSEAWDTDTLSAFDILTPNATETGIFLGDIPASLAEAAAAAQGLCENGAKTAIVTMGELGLSWSDGQTTGQLPAPKISAVDTVAAGDCFNGGLAVALSHNRPWLDALKFAQNCAALSTTRTGASVSAPTLAEVRSMTG